MSFMLKEGGCQEGDGGKEKRTFLEEEVESIVVSSLIFIMPLVFI